jgi:RimK family alpha-L-glutamate ligase
LKKARHSDTINAKVGEKMTSFLVVNHFLHSKKFDELHSHLINTAKQFGIDLQIRTNQEMIFETKTPNFVLFWDKDICLARELENKGIPVFNSSSAIEVCDDKAKTYLALQDKVPQPKTIIAPLSYFSTDYTRFVENSAEIVEFPLVYKERCGSFGEQVFLCNSVDEVLSHIDSKPFLLQEFISESAGEDVRIEVVGGKCVSAMKRKNDHDFRSNITNGGIASPYTPTDLELELALTSCNELGLDFGGVDIMNGGIVCEVNSNAHIMNIMNCTGIDIAPMIFNHIINSLS